MLKYWTLAVLVAATGCSDDVAGHDGAHDSGVEETAADSGGDDAASDTGAAVDAPSGKPMTPAITTVVPMAGAWHVSWKSNDTALTKIELWRSDDGAAATLVKAFGGTAKDWHDSAAPGTIVKYCWTVKTFRGADASDASAEKCSK
jgi:hypothetical protein